MACFRHRLVDLHADLGVPPMDVLLVDAKSKHHHCTKVESYAGSSPALSYLSGFVSIESQTNYSVVSPLQLAIIDNKRSLWKKGWSAQIDLDTLPVKCLYSRAIIGNEIELMKTERIYVMKSETNEDDVEVVGMCQEACRSGQLS